MYPKGAGILFLTRIEGLCEAHKTNITTVLKELGLSSSKGTAWQNGTIPKGDILSKLAAHFNVTTDYLLGLSPIPNPLEIPDILKGVPMAFHRGEFEDLTQEEVDNLAIIAAGYKATRKTPPQ